MASSPPDVGSLLATVDADPYGYFARVREAGGVVWDEEMGAWIVGSYEACRAVTRDETRFRHPYADMADEALIEVEGGPRSITILRGPAHERYHRWWLAVLSPRLVDGWRASYLRPVIERQLDRVAPLGRAELAEDLCERIPIRMIAAVMGLPWEDDAWIARCKELMDVKMEFLENRHALDADEDVSARGAAAARELAELVRPYVEERRAGEGDDFVSLLWRDGATILPDWDIGDVMAGAVSAFFAGTDTTTHALENALHHLMREPHLQEELRTGDEDTIERFSEEVLRLYGAVQFRPRMANADTDLAGARIRKDDVLISLHASANVDEARYERPLDVDLCRAVPRDHIALGFGPRFCVGAALARAEIEETTALTVSRLHALRLDPDAEPPRYAGLMLKGYRPLHALYDDAGAQARA